MGQHRKLNKMDQHNKTKWDSTKKLNKMGQHKETKQNGTPKRY